MKLKTKYVPAAKWAFGLGFGRDFIILFFGAYEITVNW